MADGVVVRGIRRIRGMLAPPAPCLPPKLLAQLRQQMHECAIGMGGEVSARLRAGKLGETYLKLDDDGRHEFLRLIAVEFGPDPEAVATAHAAWQSAIGSAAQWDAEAGLRAAASTPSSRNCVYDARLSARSQPP